MARSSSSRSSSPRRGKRDYRQARAGYNDYHRGNQTRKRIHKDNGHHDYSRDFDREKTRRPEQHDDRVKRHQRQEQRLSIRFEEKQPVKLKQEPQSQIKIHFRFKPIKRKLDPSDEQKLIKTLKDHISLKIGPVDYFDRSHESREGYLIFQFGFRYDKDALSYLNGTFSQIYIKIQKQQVKITAEPSRTFQLVIQQMQEKKKKSKSYHREKSKSKSRQKQQKNKNKKRRNYSRSYSSSPSPSEKSRSKSRWSADSQREKRRKDREQSSHKKSAEDKLKFQQKQGYSPQKRQPAANSGNLGQSVPTSSRSLKQVSKQQPKRLRTLCFFGIHSSVSLNVLQGLFNNHKQGPFNHQDLTWRRVKDSISQYLQGKFEQKDALRLLQIGDKLEVRGHPFIIIETQSTQREKLLQKLSQFQIDLQFPRPIEPYHLLKGMKQCGRVIQIISKNRLSQQSQSDYYNITFNSKYVCEKLKQIKKTSKQIIIDEVTVENAVCVYRPNSKTELLSADYSEDQKKNQSKRSIEKDRNYNY